jgi:hypothetical protein
LKNQRVVTAVWALTPANIKLAETRAVLWIVDLISNIRNLGACWKEILLPHLTPEAFGKQKILFSEHLNSPFGSTRDLYSGWGDCVNRMPGGKKKRNFFEKKKKVAFFFPQVV